MTESYRKSLEYVPRLLNTLDEKEIIRVQVNRLIQWCYDPCEEPGVGWRLSSKVKKLGAVYSEFINWGDLSCVEVNKYDDGSFEVVIEEAAPECPAFCIWIATWLEIWGWKCNVRTEW